MNVELKFKPGVRTSLNSNNNIRDNFSSDKGKSGVAQTRNSTATSATANLTTMQRASGNWNSSTGSILNGNAPTRSMNSRSSSGAPLSAAMSRTSPQQGTRISENYVSARRTTEYTRPQYTQYQDLGFTRASNMTGYNDRAWQRVLDGVYGKGSYAQPTYVAPHTGGSASDKITTATNVAELATGFVNLGKTIWDTFSSKDSKAAVGGGGAVGGTASEATQANVKSMQSADDSAALSSAINLSKSDLTSTKASVESLEKQLQTANENKEIYQTNLTKATETRDGLKKQVDEQTNIRNSSETALNGANGAKDLYEAAKSAYDAAPADAPNKQELKDAMDAAKAKVDALQKKIDDANKMLKDLEPKLQDAENDVKTAKEAVDNNNKVLEEVPGKLQNAKASVATYEKEIPKQEERLKKLQEKEDKELKKLNEQVADLQGECTTLNESGKTDKAKKKEEKLLKVSEEQQALQEKVDIRNLNNVVYQGGHEFKSGFDSHGQPIFVIDGKKVTEEEYKQQLGTETT